MAGRYMGTPLNVLHGGHLSIYFEIAATQFRQGHYFFLASGQTLPLPAHVWDPCPATPLYTVTKNISVQDTCPPPFPTPTPKWGILFPHLMFSWKEGH